MKKSTNNKQVFNNSQKNIKFNAWRDIINWNFNKTEIIDNSWYPIEKSDKTFLEIIWKYIEWKIWEKWWVLLSNLLKIIWLLVTTTPSFLILSFPKNTELWKFTYNTGWVFVWIGILIIALWYIITRSIEYKKNSQCPKCKKPYSLIEVWVSKEKEVKTSKWYIVTQIRNYKCKNCNFEKKDESSFIRPLN